MKYKFVNLVITLILFFLNGKIMAQNTIILTNEKNKVTSIISISEKSKNAASILKTHLDQAFDNPFSIYSVNNKTDSFSNIILKIDVKEDIVANNAFVIKSDERNIELIGSNEKTLRYAVYTLLELWGFRKYTSKVSFIPKLNQVEYPKNTVQNFKPSFEYRALFYPDCYDESFRDWHKLDWHIDDFGIWGHSFYKLLNPKTFFRTNPEYFALYEGERNPESFCMTNNNVVDIIGKKMGEIITQNQEARFFSVSQNDDVVYCECEQCQLLNEKHGGPQGSFYYFINKIAALYPKTKITTLAYLHTYRAPVNLTIAPNVYTLLCPIQMNRGKAIVESTRDKSFLEILNKWSSTSPNLYLWDYTVEFTNYLSPFPNLHTFSKNFKLYEQNNVKGLFVQGYADVAGDLYELRQYLLAKIIWNSNEDVDKLTNDFLNGFYGGAAPFVRNYIDLLTQYQQKTDRYLDIYSGPVHSRNSFLTPEAMNEYDKIIHQAEVAVKNNPILESRVLKLRLALEYVYFEQAKFYGKDKHGIFAGKNKEDEGNQLRERVRNFAKSCKDFGIYELSEGGLSPDQYFEEWIAIEKNHCKHLGEKYEVRFLVPPADENKGKGAYGLVDGVRGYKNPAINWIGWYGTNPEIEITTNKLNINTIRINSLNDHRHWIFTPLKISVYGLKNEKWQLILSLESSELIEETEVSIKTWEFKSDKFNQYDVLKIVIDNLKELPYWRKRKNKMPMVMIDEIELYNK